MRLWLRHDQEIVPLYRRQLLRGQPLAAGVFLSQALSVFISPAVLLELPKEFLDVEQRPGVFLLVLAVKQVGVQVSEKHLFGAVVCAEAVSQGVARGRLGRDILGGGGGDHLPDQCLGFLELLHSDQALGLGQPRLALADRAIGKRGDQSIELRDRFIMPALPGEHLGPQHGRTVGGAGQLRQIGDRGLGASIIARSQLQPGQVFSGRDDVPAVGIGAARTG